MPEVSLSKSLTRRPTDNKRNAAIVSFAVFAFLVLGLKLGWWDSMDKKAAETLADSHTEVLTKLFKLLSELGSTTAYVVLFAAAAGILLLRKHVLEAGVLFLAVAGSYGLNSLLKGWLERERPPLQHLIEADGYSFPSGNAMVGTAFYGMVAYMLLRTLPGRGSRIIVGLIIILLLIGFSRVYLNVHYPTDILAGYAAGAGWLFICSLILNRKHSTH